MRKEIACCVYQIRLASSNALSVAPRILFNLSSVAFKVTKTKRVVILFVGRSWSAKERKVVYSSGRFGISRSRKKWIISIKRGRVQIVNPFSRSKASSMEKNSADRRRTKKKKVISGIMIRIMANRIYYTWSSQVIKTEEKHDFKGSLWRITRGHLKWPPGPWYTVLLMVFNLARCGSLCVAVFVM